MTDDEIKAAIALREQEIARLKQMLPIEKPHPRAGRPGYFSACWTSGLFAEEINEEMAEMDGHRDHDSPTPTPGIRLRSHAD